MMILYGRDLSPFVRRVALWCALQDREVERRRITVAGADFEEIRAHNPVARVPILILEDGTHLCESWAICDWLEETAPAGRRLLPASGTARRDCLQRMALANGVSEKAVAMVYERNRRPEALHWDDWQRRVAGQVQGGLAALEAQTPAAGLFGGDAPDGSDIAVAVAVQFVEATNSWLLSPGYPRLMAHAARMTEIPGFAATRPDPVDGQPPAWGVTQRA